MVRPDKTQWTLIEKKIADVETRTSGEIVVSIIEASSSYLEFHLLFALLGWVVGSIYCFFSPWHLGPLDWICAQACLMALFYSVLYIPPLRRLVVPGTWMSRQVHSRAREIFWNAGLTETRDRTGVLILISLLEHRVEILADKGIYTAVENEYWNREVELIIAGIRKQEMIPTLLQAIESIGKKLETKFPRRSGDTNELSNQVRSED